MLELILGTSGTGKTKELLRRITARAEQGETSYYLVPEQFSQSAELLLYDTLGDRLSAFAEVLSFRTLAGRIERQCGGSALPPLTDAGRCVFVRRAIAALGDEVKYYRRHRGNTAFLVGCADAISELKTAGAGSDQLRHAAARAGSEKLAELALIYDASEAAIAGKALDPSDRITRAAENLCAGMLGGAAFYIDDFDGFTAPEYALLRRLLAQCPVTVTLCCDGLADHEGGYGLFSPVKKTARRLIELAKQQGETVQTPLLLHENHRAGAAGLAAVDALLCGAAPEGALPSDGVFYFTADDREDEAAKVAATVRGLAAQGLRYSEIVIVCRTLDDYRAPLAAALAGQQVPFFIDSSTTAEYTAPTAFLRAALGLARGGLASRPLLALLKTGLCGVAADAVSALENYAFTWQPNAAAWRAPFTLNPAGLGAPTPEDEAQLQLAEQARQAVLGPVGEFLEHIKNPTGALLSRRLWLLLDAFDAPAQMGAAAQALRDAGQGAAADDALKMWDAAVTALDELNGLLGEDRITPGEYDELLVLLLRAGEIGRVPRTLDTVLVTTADRMRLPAPAAVFAVGLAEGEFPKQVGYSGLLTHADRELLVEEGIEMPGSFENRVLLEQMFLYRTLTAPRSRLTLSVPEAAGGEPKSPAAPAAALMARLSPPTPDFGPAQLYAAPPAALAGVAVQYAADTEITAALAAALAEVPQQAALLQNVQQAARPHSLAVEDTAALRRLLGGRLTLSPTRIERYYSCSYAYFLEYVLKLKVRRKAELSPIESGSFVHYVLENALRRMGADFLQQTPQQLTELAGALCDEYVAANIPAALAAGTRFAYLVERIKANAARLLVFLQKEQRQSSFVPVAFELPIGPDAEVKPLRLKTPDGEPVQVVGKVDRVDTMQREGVTYLRVIDYKTGTKDFRLDDVWCGLNLQMLVYLFSLCGADGGPFAGAVPAGVLYLSADPPPPMVERQTAAAYEFTYAVDGLVLDDDMVVRAMDKEGTGAFIPVSRTTTGRLRKSQKLADLAKLGRIEQKIEELVAQMAGGLYGGDIDAEPWVRGNTRPCDWCDFRSICRHVDGRHERQLTAPDDAFEEKERGQQA